MYMLKAAAAFAVLALLGACSVDGHVNRCGIGAGVNLGPGEEHCVPPHPVAWRGPPSPGYHPPPAAYYGPPPGGHPYGPGYGASAYGPPPPPRFIHGGPAPSQTIVVEHWSGKPGEFKCVIGPDGIPHEVPPGTIGGVCRKKAPGEP